MSWIERAPADDGTGRTSLVGPLVGCGLLLALALLVALPAVWRWWSDGVVPAMPRRCRL